MKGVIRSVRDSSVFKVVLAASAGVLFVTMVANASTTISTNISTDGTLAVTGLSTLTAGFTSQASSTVVGAFTGTGATALGSTLGVTSLATLTGGYISQASSTVVGALTTTGAISANSTVTVGSGGSSITNLVFGFCTASVAVNATSSAYVSCTGATGVTTSDRVLVMGTSTLPDRVSLIAASSSGVGTIELEFFNNGIDGGNLSSTPVSFNFIGIH